MAVEQVKLHTHKHRNSHAHRQLPNFCLAEILTWRLPMAKQCRRITYGVSAKQINWRMIWSIWFTADKWQYLWLWGNWSDINQQAVKYESFKRVLNCFSVLKPVRNWLSPLQAAWETLPGKDSIRAVMQIVLWAFKGNRSQSGEGVQICWLLFWSGQAFYLVFILKKCCCHFCESSIMWW